MNCVAGLWTSDKSMVREIEWLCGFFFPVYRAEIFIMHNIVMWLPHFLELLWLDGVMFLALANVQGV